MWDEVPVKKNVSLKTFEKLNNIHAPNFFLPFLPLPLVLEKVNCYQKGKRFLASSGRTDLLGQIITHHIFRTHKIFCLRILRD